jgi:hypothetical protein
VATGLAILFIVCFFAALGGLVRASASGDFSGHLRGGEIITWWGVIATFAVLMIIAAVIATPAQRRWSARQRPTTLEASNAAVPALTGVHWLQRRAGVERRMRQAAIISCVMLLFCGVLLWQGYDRLKRHAGSQPKPAVVHALDQFRKGVIAEGLIMMTLFLQIAVELRSRRVRLGTDGRQVFAELPTGELLTASAERVVYDRRSIAFENCLVRINTPKGRSLYEAKEVETYLAPLLGRARKLSPFGMLGYRLVHREGALVATLLCYLLCAVLFIVTGAWQPVWAGLLKKLHSG